MSSRKDILASLRAAQRTPALLPDVPMFDAGLPPARDKFIETLALMGGVWAEMPADGDIDTLIRARFPDAKVICSAVTEVNGTRRIETVRDPHDLDDVDVGIVRPLFAVAETGRSGSAKRNTRSTPWATCPSISWPCSIPPTSSATCTMRITGPSSSLRTMRC
jgi:hypothetical protein